MVENKTIQDKDLDMPCKHKNHTSLKHIGLKLACQDSSCKRPFIVFSCVFNSSLLPFEMPLNHFLSSNTTVSNRNAGRTVETPDLWSYNAEFRSFSMDSPPFLVF